MALILILMQFALLAGLASLFATSSQSSSGLIELVKWSEEYGLKMALSLDSSSLILSLIVASLGTVILGYSLVYFTDNAKRLKTMIFLFLFELPMVLLCLSADFITAFMSFEAISIISFALIAFQYEDTKTRENARLVLMSSIVSGLLLMAGLSQAWLQSQSPILADWNSQNVSSTALFLILAGALIKSAQFPFHFWLPAAMTAPTPASAYLHSSTLVKAGLIICIKIYPGFATHPYFGALAYLGAFTALLCAFLALVQEDMKASFAYSTLYALGLITTSLSIPDGTGAQVALALILIHACYKAPLFLHLGYCEKLAGTRMWGAFESRLSVFGFATGAMACVIMLGFGLGSFAAFKKVLFVELSPVAYSLLLAATLFNATLALRYLVATFPHKIQFFGVKDKLSVFPFVVVAGFFSLGVTGLQGLSFEGSYNSDSSRLLYASLINLAALVLALTHRSWMIPLVGKIRLIISLDHNNLLAIWSSMVQSSLGFAKAISAPLISKDPFRNFQILVFSFVAVLCIPLFYNGIPAQIDSPNPADMRVTILCLISCLCALSMFFHVGKLPTLFALSGVGLSQSLLFLFLGAPDVAKTQLLVETLSLAVIAFVFSHMSYFKESVQTFQKPELFRVVVSILGGLAFFCASSILIGFQPGANLTQYFMENSLKLAHGLNVVNVILVDFRAFDTFGEVTVLAMAAVSLGVLFKKNWRKA